MTRVTPQPQDARFDPDEARKRWQRLGYKTQAKIIDAARSGVPIPEGQAHEVALGWAWVILGRPFERRRNRWYQYVAMAISTGGDKLSNYQAMNGYRQNDLIPKVRRAARAVEGAYLHPRRPTAPYRRPEPGLRLKPEWFMRFLWGPGPQDAKPEETD